jgi:hypothetical protein
MAQASKIGNGSPILRYEKIMPRATRLLRLRWNGEGFADGKEAHNHPLRTVVKI